MNDMNAQQEYQQELEKIQQSDFTHSWTSSSGFLFYLQVGCLVAFLFGGDPGYWWAVARAHFAVYGWLLWGQKESLFPKNRSGQLQGMYKGSILWDYFLAGKKTFARIISGHP